MGPTSEFNVAGPLREIYDKFAPSQRAKRETLVCRRLQIDEKV